ncbi:helix-turn-helix transcriptional regulator [Phytohabitans sp. ZYX-F-186]|uniref:Helix-turn-helix transcriptional regulator n=1 Tax=Phytohabitans maris TaxID=3071409 RepID=A0ABU0ZJY6_9ACTN|nr:helix-turn-helix transcriptional regulator [Phytohabitans sp. ZYX-F-186]MDQ7907354.1 helix-turn-helix transcriptional regulator [Phytohabitans sp. ZYX-F-186]
MTSPEPPAVARRRVRLALRAAREARGFTQQHVADELDWSLSKVNRIEKGDVTVSKTDLLALLELFGVDDDDLIDELVRAARSSRQRGWWDEPRYREHLTAAMLQLLQFETEATAIRVFQPTVVNGPFQTRAYAQAVLDFWQPELSQVVREARLETRLRRGEQLLGRADPPDIFCIFDESVLHRPVGGVEVMAEQLRQLLVIMRRPNVHVRVVPFAQGALVAMLGPFLIFDFGDEENAVLYRESLLLDEVLHTGEALMRHRGYFEHLWRESLGETESAKLIAARADQMLPESDRYTSG